MVKGRHDLVKKVIIVTDSLGGPRYAEENIFYEDTWVFKIINFFKPFKDIEFYPMVVYGLDSRQLLEKAKTELPLYKPDFVILQFGIVDCAPRALKEKEIKFFTFLKLSGIVQKLASKYHNILTTIRKIERVKIREFKYNVKIIFDILRNNNAKVIVIPIAPPCIGFIKHSPRVKDNIIKYNKVLEENADYFLVNAYKDFDPEECFLKDLHHLNRKGHSILFENIKNDLLVILTRDFIGDKIA
jgi:lysophospholipase L1-like esterase